MNTHAQFQLGMYLQRFADFERAFDRRFRAVEKHQRHPVASWKPDQLAGGFGGTDLLGVSDNLGQLLLELALLVDKQFRVTNHVHEQDMSDL